MKQDVRLSADGRITIEQDDARFEFQVLTLSERRHIRLLEVKWMDRDHFRRLESLDQARATARWWAQEQGWVRQGERTVAL